MYYFESVTEDMLISSFLEYVFDVITTVSWISFRVKRVEGRKRRGGRSSEMVVSHISTKRFTMLISNG